MTNYKYKIGGTVALIYVYIFTYFIFVINFRQVEIGVFTVYIL